MGNDGRVLPYEKGGSTDVIGVRVTVYHMRDGQVSYCADAVQYVTADSWRGIDKDHAAACYQEDGLV